MMSFLQPTDRLTRACWGGARQNMVLRADDRRPGGDRAASWTVYHDSPSGPSPFLDHGVNRTDPRHGQEKLAPCWTPGTAALGWPGQRRRSQAPRGETVAGGPSRAKAAPAPRGAIGVVDGSAPITAQVRIAFSALLPPAPRLGQLLRRPRSTTRCSSTGSCAWRWWSQEYALRHPPDAGPGRPAGAATAGLLGWRESPRAPSLSHAKRWRRSRRAAPRARKRLLECRRDAGNVGTFRGLTSWCFQNDSGSPPQPRISLGGAREYKGGPAMNGDPTGRRVHFWSQAAWTRSNASSPTSPPSAKRVVGLRHGPQWSVEGCASTGRRGPLEADALLPLRTPRPAALHLAAAYRSPATTPRLAFDVWMLK